MPKVNLNSLISEAAKKLQGVGIETGASEVEMILCELLEIDRLQLYLRGPSLIDDELTAKFNGIIERRLTRYPLQYILGSAWFFGRKFLVNESVMVPCPETELLLDSVLRAARQLSSDPVRLLDIGTGSGVVAISAKLENENLDVTAFDISARALETARQNAARFDVEDKVRFIESDLFEALDKSEKFDIIASNPPYIANGEYESLPPEVKADPKKSLLAGEKGLDVIERLIRFAPDHLCSPGFLIFEIGYDQSRELFEIVGNDNRYDDCSLFRDLNDIDRVFICRAQ
jgi:release factor glutamine methyltransferase